MPNTISNLKSALSEINKKYSAEPAKLHFAVALIISSYFRRLGVRCCIVGGQAAAYWMRITGSVDSDFVIGNTGKAAELLETVGFKRDSGRSYQFLHSQYSLLVELVGEEIEVAGVKLDRTVLISPNEVSDKFTKKLMAGPAEVIDPVLVFLNYLEACGKGSVWFDERNQGMLAAERARAVFELYEKYIRETLEKEKKFKKIPDVVLSALHSEFKVNI